MKGRVLLLHDGRHLDVVQGEPIPLKAIVQFESVTLMGDQRMKWERVADTGYLAKESCSTCVHSCA